MPSASSNSNLTEWSRTHEFEYDSSASSSKTGLSVL